MPWIMENNDKVTTTITTTEIAILTRTKMQFSEAF